MLVTEYKQKVIDLLKEHRYKHINNQHDMLVQFTECTLLEDIIYYLYCKDCINYKRILRTQVEVLHFLTPSFVFNYDKYKEMAKIELRNYKIKKICYQDQ